MPRARRALGRPSHPSALSFGRHTIADAAVPFVIATLAGGAMLLLQPSLGGECASATRRGTLHIAVGSFLTHMATSLSAKR